VQITQQYLQAFWLKILNMVQRRQTTFEVFSVSGSGVFGNSKFLNHREAKQKAQKNEYHKDFFNLLQNVEKW